MPECLPYRGSSKLKIGIAPAEGSAHVHPLDRSSDRHRIHLCAVRFAVRRSACRIGEARADAVLLT
jgi:hypothetical protein